MIAQLFTINNVEVPANLLSEQTFPNGNGESCITQATLLSGWKVGETDTFALEQTFSKDINDRHSSYDAGRYLFVVYVSVQ